MAYRSPAGPTGRTPAPPPNGVFTLHVGWRTALLMLLPAAILLGWFVLNLSMAALRDGIVCSRGPHGDARCEISATTLLGTRRRTLGRVPAGSQLVLTADPGDGVRAIVLQSFDGATLDTVTQPAGYRQQSAVDLINQVLRDGVPDSAGVTFVPDPPSRRHLPFAALAALVALLAGAILPARRTWFVLDRASRRLRIYGGFPLRRRLLHDLALDDVRGVSADTELPEKLSAFGRWYVRSGSDAAYRNTAVFLRSEEHGRLRVSHWMGDADRASTLVEGLQSALRAARAERDT